MYHFGYYGVYFSAHMLIEKYWEGITPDSIPTDGSVSIMEIPITSIPYLAEEVNFRPTNIQFEKDGRFFRAIKQRYTEESLQILYVPDTASNNLSLTLKQWVTSLTQDGTSNSAPDLLLLQIIAKHYVMAESSLHFFSFFCKSVANCKPYQVKWVDPLLEIIAPPPNFS